MSIIHFSLALPYFHTLRDQLNLSYPNAFSVISVHILKPCLIIILIGNYDFTFSHVARQHMQNEQNNIIQTMRILSIVSLLYF